MTQSRTPMKKRKVKRVRKPRPFVEAFSRAEINYGLIDFSICCSRDDYAERTYSLERAKRLHRWLTNAIIYLEQDEQK